MSKEETAKSTWEDYVSMMQSNRGTLTDVYLTDVIAAPANYNELCYTLDKADSDEVFKLHINNGGGYVSTAFMIVESIKKTKAKVICVLSGTVASAATMIALACDELEIAPFTHFMIHNYSVSMIENMKGNELKAYAEFSSKEIYSAFRTIYKGFLTTEEMDSVLEDKDMWLNAEDVRDRWASKGLEEND